MFELFALSCLALVAGMVSVSSPCVLPLLPGYVSFVGGLRAGGCDRTDRRRVLGGAALFVLGFSAVFTALGATASGLGLLLGRNQQALDVVGGAFVVAMGLTVTGFVRIPGLHRELRADLGRFGRGPAGALPLGAAFALGWTPCVGPVLASILATAAGTATVARGALLLGVYSLGLGLPFLALAARVARGTGDSSWWSRHARRIQIGGGVLLVATGITMITGSWTSLMGGMLGLYARLGWPPI